MNFKWLFLILWIAFSACSPKGPEPIDWQRDNCFTCKMTFVDQRFGAEVITQKGKIYKFDSYECLFNFLKTLPSNSYRVYVVDFSENGSLIPVESAFFLNIANLHGPMGKGILASESKETFSPWGDEALKSLVSWSQLQKQF